MKLSCLSVILLSSLVYCDPCPDGFTQAPNGGDCYSIKYWYSTLLGQFNPPKSFDDVEYECNLNVNVETGGMLASIHSEEENEYMRTLMQEAGYCYQVTNIGLRCTGNDCKWDDGSPVTYTNFEGEGPPNDKQVRCYGVHYRGIDSLTWSPKDCGTYPADCWLCSVTAKKIECNEDEFPYKGGCVSVHTTPLDQKSAEASCQQLGGHLISVHSNYERYIFFALRGRAIGTIYIGGQFSNGKFEWLDGSYPNYDGWAYGFPNNIFGSCVQMLLESELGSAGAWTNVECSTKQAYMCFRNGEAYGPTAFPPPPKADAQCPPIQYYSGTGTGSGNKSIYSPNYPLSIPSRQSCEYIIGTKEGTSASLKFLNMNCQSGSSFYFYDGLNSNQPFLTFTNSSPTVNSSYTAKSNVLKVVFSVTTSMGTGWEAEFRGV